LIAQLAAKVSARNCRCNLLLFLRLDFWKLLPVLRFANALACRFSRIYLVGFGLGSGNANVAETDGAGDVEPPGDVEDVAIGEGLGDGVGVGVGGGGIIFSQ